MREMLVRLMGTICFALGLSGCADAPQRPGPPHIVLIVIDSLRADHLPDYGYPVNTAPFLARFAASGVLFERVIAPSSWTKTSMASIMTGQDPASHGVLRHRNTVPQGLPTLAKQLAAHRYETIGVNTNPWLQAQFGFSAGFAVYETIRHAKKSGQASEVNRRALDLLAARPRDRPVFLYLHYMDVHAPYRSDLPEGSGSPLRLPELGEVDDETLERAYRKEGLIGPGVEKRVIELYDAGIRNLDAALERLLHEIHASLPPEDTLVVITSDHGEAFREHGTTEHGHNLYPEVIRVPLIFVWPGVLPANMRIGAQVRSIDIAPTLLELAEVNIPDVFEGSSLLPMHPDAITDRVAHSEVYFRRPLPPFHFTAVVSPNHFYVREKMKDAVEFYDLRSDPNAYRDLGTAHPHVGAYAAVERSAEVVRPPERELDAETREELEGLGYLK